MTDGINALTKAVQGTAPQAALNHPNPKPHLKQLPSANHPMLSTGKLPNYPINRADRPLTSTRPTFPFYAIGNAGLVGHATDSE